MYKVNKLTLTDHAYPQLLKHIPDAPETLYVRGSIEALSFNTSLSVVGSRKPTAYGRGVTELLTREVAQKGIPIVSGLALGIDSIAHKAALEVDCTTVAVLPGGLERIYPTSHRYIAETILKQGGALVSEYPEGTPPIRSNFIARNRIVSGLTSATLITEAAQRSGTLHTAKFALEQGRSVLAVPGPITSPYSKGTNSLLSSGARIVTEAQDILDEIGASDTNDLSQTELLAATEEEHVIIELLRDGVTDGRELLAKSKLETSAFNQTMTMLEISGKISPLGADTWGLK